MRRALRLNLLSMKAVEATAKYSWGFGVQRKDKEDPRSSKCRQHPFWKSRCRASNHPVPNRKLRSLNQVKHVSYLTLNIPCDKVLLLAVGHSSVTR
jgi:hypothetical protein